VRSNISMPMGSLASVLRPNRGRSRQPGKPPELPLELWGCEGSMECKFVREYLCELEIVHLQRPVGEGSQVVAELRERSGSDVTPWLHDPNAGVGIAGANEILGYLEKTYTDPVP